MACVLRKTMSMFIPLHTIHFNFAKTCSLSCRFCYINTTKNHTDYLSIDELGSFADDAKSLGAKRLILSQAEPLLRGDWRTVAQIGNDHGLEISLDTTATLVTEPDILFLKTLAPTSHSISIDGRKTTHDSLHGINGAYDSSMASMYRFKEAGLQFDITMALLRATIPDIPHLTKLARTFKSTARLSFRRRSGKEIRRGNEYPNPREILQVREYCHIMRKNGIDMFLNLPPLLQYIDGSIPTRESVREWAEPFCGLLANGDASICGVSDGVPLLFVGNVKAEPFKEIWTKADALKRSISYEGNRVNGICGRCPFNSYCNGACHLWSHQEDDGCLGLHGLCQNFYDEGFIPENILNPPIAAVANLEKCL